MKMRTSGLFLLSMLGLWACEDGGETTDQPAVEAPPPAPEEAKPAEPEKAPEATPDEVCGQFTAAVKAADQDKIAALLAPGGAEALAGEGVKDAVTRTFGNATCGEAKIDGDKATVMITVPPAEDAKPAKKAKKKAKDAKPAEPTSMEVPFMKGADGWKVDLGSYLAAHPVEAGAKGKKGKKAKKKGA